MKAPPTFESIEGLLTFIANDFSWLVIIFLVTLTTVAALERAYRIYEIYKNDKEE